MILKTIKYSQYKGEPKEWNVQDLTLGSLNLVVGKNASGKTRTLNILDSLSKLLSGEIKLHFKSGDYDITFEYEGKILNYVLKYKDSKVFCEEFALDGDKKLIRGSEGKGEIFAEKEGKMLAFQTPEDELAVVARRDKIQHSYFEALHEWATSVSLYHFGQQMGKDTFAVIRKNLKQEKDLKDENQIVAIYKTGEERFREDFKKVIIEDMRNIKFEVEDLGLKTPESVILPAHIEGEFVGLSVKEKDLKFPIEQFEISQGMFRALSIIIHLNYLILTSKPACILVDDIGEGLDFERSSLLIKLIMRKAKEANIQIILTTNDRFVMNLIPLENWLLIRRSGNTCRFYSYNNSKEIFDEFKFTGLNNFDFFSTDYLDKVTPNNA